MKKRSILLAVLLVATTTIHSFGAEITVNVNKNKIHFPDVKPYIDKADRTLVPIRFVADELKAETSWNEQTQTATIRKADKTIDICLKCKKVRVNGKDIVTDSIGEKKDDKRTMVPLRFISENFGAKVDWNTKTLTVDIATTTEPAISVPPAPTKPMEMKEIPRSELPKELTDDLNPIEKIYNGAGIDWDIQVHHATRDGFGITAENMENPFSVQYVVFTDGKIESVYSGVKVHGNHLGKTIDKLYVGGDDFKSYYVDIDDILIQESK